MWDKSTWRRSFDDTKRGQEEQPRSSFQEQYSGWQKCLRFASTSGRLATDNVIVDCSRTLVLDVCLVLGEDYEQHYIFPEVLYYYGTPELWCLHRYSIPLLDELPNEALQFLLVAPGLKSREAFSPCYRCTYGSTIAGPMKRFHWNVDSFSGDSLSCGCGCYLPYLLWRREEPICLPHRWPESTVRNWVVWYIPYQYIIITTWLAAGGTWAQEEQEHGMA